jgi:hypothetical protein
MPSVREHLIFKALAALQEVREASKDAPVDRSWQLRFCLAFLFTQGNGNREPFQHFWLEMQNLHPTSTDAGRYMRHCELGRAITGVIRVLGFNDTPRIGECLNRPHCGQAANDFWLEVQTQLNDGRPMPTPRFKRG